MFMVAAEEIGVAELVVVETTHPARVLLKRDNRLREHAATGS